MKITGDNFIEVVKSFENYRNFEINTMALSNSIPFLAS